MARMVGGRAAEAAVDVDLDVTFGRDGCDSLVDRRLRPRLQLGRARPHVDAQDSEIGHDIAGASALDPRRVHRQPVGPHRVQPEREVCGGEVSYVV